LRPHHSTRFPYTTLFRSINCARSEAVSPRETAKADSLRYLGTVIESSSAEVKREAYSISLRRRFKRTGRPPTTLDCRLRLIKNLPPSATPLTMSVPRSWCPVQPTSILRCPKYLARSVRDSVFGTTVAVVTRSVLSGRECYCRLRIVQVQA